MTSFLNAGKVEHECQPLDKAIVDKLTEAVHQGETATTRKAIVVASYPAPVPALPPRHPQRTETKNQRTRFHTFLKTRASKIQNFGHGHPSCGADESGETHG
jgi:hypothetical protein